MGWRMQNRVREHSQSKNTTRVVLYALAYRINDASGSWRMSYERIAIEANCSLKSVGRAVRWLVEHGELACVKRAGVDMHPETGRPMICSQFTMLLPPSAAEPHSDVGNKERPSGGCRRPRRGVPPANLAVSLEKPEKHEVELQNKTAAQPPLPVPSREAIFDGSLDPLDLALAFTGQSGAAWARNTYGSYLRRIGEKLFRECLHDFTGRLAEGGVKNPGALLTSVLDACLERLEMRRASAETQGCQPSGSEPDRADHRGGHLNDAVSNRFTHDRVT